MKRIAFLVLVSLALRNHICLVAAAATPDLPVRSGLRSVDDAVPFGEAISLPMKYGIFSGRSSLRSLTDIDILDLLRPPRKLGTNNLEDADDPSALQRAAAVLLLLRGNLESSHEVVLGVTPSQAEDGEYAATHPGQTSWYDDHPLTTASDMIHAAMHRLEGAARGEGNHTGFENAKYWAMGGPKMLDRPALHPVREMVAERAKRRASHCVARGVVAGTDPGTHCIVAGGGKKRTVQTPPPGEWDDIAFVNVCKLRSEGMISAEECAEVSDLQRAEMLYLLVDELVGAGFGRSVAVAEREHPIDRETLLRSAQSLCDDFANHEPLEKVLDHFSSSRDDEILCFEHGLRHPSVPFLGRAFRGREGAREYFELIAKLLSYADMRFSEYFVDMEQRAVSVRGEATFLWLSTGQSWDEVFTYRLRFDEEGKVVRYEVWADGLAAYLAGTGRLENKLQ